MRFTGVAIAGLTLSIAVGLAAGVGGYTFVFARGASYLTDDPAACALCPFLCLVAFNSSSAG